MFSGENTNPFGFSFLRHFLIFEKPPLPFTPTLLLLTLNRSPCILRKLGWAKLGWNGLGCSWLYWAGLGWSGLVWAVLGWVVLYAVSVFGTNARENHHIAHLYRYKCASTLLCYEQNSTRICIFGKPVVYCTTLLYPATYRSPKNNNNDTKDIIDLSALSQK